MKMLGIHNTFLIFTVFLGMLVPLSSYGNATIEALVRLYVNSRHVQVAFQQTRWASSLVRNVVRHNAPNPRGPVADFHLNGITSKDHFESFVGLLGANEAKGLLTSLRGFDRSASEILGGLRDLPEVSTYQWILHNHYRFSAPNRMRAEFRFSSREPGRVLRAFGDLNPGPSTAPRIPRTGDGSSAFVPSSRFTSEEFIRRAADSRQALETGARRVEANEEVMRDLITHARFGEKLGIRASRVGWRDAVRAARLTDLANSGTGIHNIVATDMQDLLVMGMRLAQSDDPRLISFFFNNSVTKHQAMVKYDPSTGHIVHLEKTGAGRHWRMIEFGHTERLASITPAAGRITGGQSEIGYLYHVCERYLTNVMVTF